ncbi:MAG: exo-alpha-sialidase [Gemmataceae bacterium]|nr:exo-alpha-sialidase [Gemmataceae bacterium]
MQLSPHIAFAIVAAMTVMLAWRPTPPPAKFVVPPTPVVAVKPQFETAFIGTVPEAPVVHSATLAPLKDGGRVAVWFGGSKEAAVDVQLYQAFYRDGAWTSPKAIFSPLSVSSAEYRFVRRIGNAALHRDVRGRLHLFFVTCAVGGWSTSILNHATSDDEAATWSNPRQFVVSPLINLSTLARQPGVNLQDGGFLLPVYHELAYRYPEMLRFDRKGQLLSKVRTEWTYRDALQPSLVPLDADRAAIWCRNMGPNQRLIYQETNDGGRTWTPIEGLAQVNPDASVAVARLKEDLFLMCHNATPRMREVLALSWSKDGKTWKEMHRLEENTDIKIEFSYPTLLVEGETIDVVYTWKRDAIKHVRFNRSWVEERLP